MMWLFFILSSFQFAICFPTTRPGCEHSGKWYMPGDLISSGQSGNWCYYQYCGDDGNVINADDFNCVKTTLPVTTIPTTPRLGCEYSGKWYMPGDLMSSGQSGDWCYYEYCGYDGNVMYADDFNCVKTTLPPTTTPTTILPV